MGIGQPNQGADEMGGPCQIIADGVYDDRMLRRTLGLSEGALAKARKSGELRFARKGLRNLYVGTWIIAWVSRDVIPAETVASRG